MMKMKWSAILAVWICWTITIQSHQIGSSTLSLPLTITDSKLGAPDYPKVSYDANSVDEEAYGETIQQLRSLLVSRGTYSHGIRRLRDPTAVPDSERYILVEIAESRGQTVTFAIDVTNVYVVGYRVGIQRYFFDEAPASAPDLLFTDATVTSPYQRSSNYNALESRAGTTREKIPLGLHVLLGAISTLITSRPEDPRSLIIVIQMISEAARYWEIESRVRNNGEFYPDSYMIDLENNWGSLSAQIQISDFLAFETTITIGDRVADNVNSFVIAGLYLMLFVCDPTASTTASSTNTSFDVPHLQLVTQQQPNLLGVGGADDQTCNHSVDPRTRIMGRNGMCVDVEKFIYMDNNPIVLFPCKTSDFKNQFWTLGKNGRIQSLEKCLAATGTEPGSSVVIHECETLDDNALGWAMSYTGELLNAHSGLALTAKDGTDASKLTLEERDDSSFQTWKATNKLTPVYAYIHGQKNQCISYRFGYEVYTETCSQESKQQWRLFPDDTIRPIDWLDGCIEIASLSSAENTISIQAGRCSESPELHKWVFSHDGAIRNWKSQKVIDASVSEPGHLVAWDFHGGMNQIWTLEYV